MHDIAEFFFAGAGTVPGVLLYAGNLGLAILALVALMLAGCLGAMADPQAPFRTAGERNAAKRAARR